jgi:O-antigen/teichoic acid export membrane protein
MSKYKLLFTNTMIFAVGNFVVKLLQFILMPLYTVTLTKEEYGNADLLSSSIELLIPVLTLSIQEAVFRFTLDKDSDKTKLLSTGLKVVCLGFIFIFILTSCFNWFFPIKYWFLMGLLYIASALRQLFAQFARGFGNSKEFAFSGIIGAFVLLVSSFILLYIFQLSINGYLLSLVLSNFVSALYLMYSVKLTRYISLDKTDSNLLKSMIIYSFPAIPNMLSWWFINISNRYIIVLFCGAGVAGLFSAASKLPSIVNLIATIFQQAWQLSSAKEYDETGRERFYSVVFKYFSASVTIASSCLLTLIPYISKFILIGEFYQSWVYVPLLMFSATIGCYSYFFGAFYLAAKKNTMAMISTLIGAIVNVILC